MDVILMLFLSLTVFFSVQFLCKKTRISQPICYLLLGIIFGGSAGLYNVFGNAAIFPNMPDYNTVALLLLFFGAGFNIDTDSLKKSGKVTTQLFSLPVHIEGIIMTVIVFLVLKLVPSLGFTLSIFEVSIVMILFAVASPANVIPISMNHSAEGYSGSSEIVDNMIIASVIDNFIIFPVLLLPLLFTVAPGMGFDFTAMKTILMILGVILGLILIVLIGIAIGFLSTVILDPIGKKIAGSKQNKLPSILYTILYFVIIAVIISFSGPLKTLGVLVAVAAGAGVKKYEKNGLSDRLGYNASLLFAIFGMPIIFIYVGSLIDLKALLNPKMLLFGVTITILACTIKGLVTSYILRDEKYSDGDRKYAMSCFIPKGVALVNFSLVFMVPFVDIGLTYVINFMIVLAAISIIVTVPLGVTLMNNAKGVWLLKNNA